MDGLMLGKFAAAFVFVISLMYLLSWILKRSGLSGASFTPSAKRRLKMVEYLPLDGRRRLVLVRCDDREHLLVLGPQGETVVENNIPAVEEATVVALAPVKEQKNA